jgi:hypothetical protein
MTTVVCTAVPIPSDRGCGERQLFRRRGRTDVTPRAEKVGALADGLTVVATTTSVA